MNSGNRFSREEARRKGASINVHPHDENPTDPALRELMGRSALLDDQAREADTRSD